MRGLDLLDRVPEDYGMEVRNIGQEAMAKLSPTKRKRNKRRQMVV